MILLLNFETISFNLAFLLKSSLHHLYKITPIFIISKSYRLLIFTPRPANKGNTERQETMMVGVRFSQTDELPTINSRLIDSIRAFRYILAKTYIVESRKALTLPALCDVLILRSGQLVLYLIVTQFSRVKLT